MTKALVVAGGDFPKNFILEGYDLVLAVDRGLEYLVEKGIEADYIIGDFDSVSISRKNFPPGEILKYPAEKSMTDLEIALDKLIEEKIDQVHIIAAIGTRLDHSLINIFLLKKLFNAGIKAKIINDNNVVFMDQGEIQVEKNNFKYLSLLPLSQCLVSMKGFKYNLNKVEVDFPSSLTISNEITDNIAFINVNKPCFIIHSND